MSLRLTSKNIGETERIGFEIGLAAEPGLVVTLKGPLGAGKTLLTKGIARGLGVPRPEYVTSPTFTIHKVYKGRLELNHLDFYRLKSGTELDDLGLEETLCGPGVCVVEWPDQFYSHLGGDRLDLSIKVTGRFAREIEIMWTGPGGASVGEALVGQFGEGRADVSYDVVFLGGGPGGYVGAIRGGQLGARVCVVEADKLGGNCLNRGCIPSKAYYSSAKRMLEVRNSDDFGIIADFKGFDLARCAKRKDSVIAELVDGIEKLLKGNNVDVVKGRGVIVNPETVRVTGVDGTVTDISAKKIIVATGSKPVELPGLAVDGKHIVTSDGIWNLPDLPARMVIVGGGVIGCEMAHIFSAFGSKVTVVEMLDRILATEDKEASRAVVKSLGARGVEFMTSVKVKKAKVKGGEVTVSLEGGEDIVCDTVVVAVGRRPQSQGIGLEAVGIKPDARGFIPVNDEMCTVVPGIFAVGDVVGKYMLAQVATSEAMVAIHNALGKKYWMDYDILPKAVFTHPEIASVGMSEAELKKDSIPYRVGRFAYAASGKAHCQGETEGFIKILSHEKTGRIVGSTIVGANAADIIHELAIAMRMEASPGDIVTTTHVHPTLSEIVLEASEDTMGLSIHKIGKKPGKGR